MASRCCWPPESKHPFVADDRFVAVRLRHDEIVREGGPRRRVNFFRRGVEPAELDVFEDGVVKQKCFLRDEADLLAQRFLRQLAQILAIDPDRAPVGSYKRKMSERMVDFPAPLGPTSA